MTQTANEQELSIELAPLKFESFTAQSVTVHLKVRNASRYIVQAGGTWSVKDESVTPPIVATATFNRIPAGGEDSQTVNLPTGFEWGAFRFFPEDYENGKWESIHAGNDTETVTLTLGNPKK